MTGSRVDGRGRVDRSRRLAVTFDGEPLQAFSGDTLASALLASGVMTVGSSVRLGRPRGISTAGSEEPTGVVLVSAPHPQPLVAATVVEAVDGLAAWSVAGRGVLTFSTDTTGITGTTGTTGTTDDSAYDAIHHHCEVAVVGAGPAGLSAALAASRTGQRVLLLDERPTAGGSLLTDTEIDWATGIAAELDSLPNVLRLQRTTVIGYYDSNYLIAVQRRMAHDGHGLPDGAVRERVWRIRADRVVLATGALERPVVFAGNDVPGVMLAESAREYLHRFGVLAGSRVVLFTTHDDAYRAAADLSSAGAAVTIVDPRTKPVGSAEAAAHDAGPGIAVLRGTVVSGTGTGPDGALSDVQIRRGDGSTQLLDADLLAVSGGWNPMVHLYSQAGGALRFDPAVGSYTPAGCPQKVTVAGAARGLRTTREAVLDGAMAGAGSPQVQGVTWPRVDLPARLSPPASLALVADPSASPRSLTTHFVDLPRDVTVADIARATGAGLGSAEHVKRYTTAGTAHDQGKTSAAVTTAVMAGLLGVEPAELGPTSYRPPYAAVSFATLAGRQRGELYEPIRVTSVHSWHVANGAVFEDVGQWKRPWYYPRGGESMADAVARECIAARSGVAFMDGSTLGKIDVQGPDAAMFLDRLYTNVMSTLKVGSVRYGVMCSLDGMVLDDGTVMRIADDHFVTTTTTGNAAKILDWMEEWLQTEWPDLRVGCTSVTEQWATMVLAGPRSRDLMRVLAPDLLLSAADFPFMTWRDTTVTNLPSRVARISFSGELAYEIHLPWYHAPALWSAVAAAGTGFDLTPYGTEAMHVLRAEKGFPIIGQDTDGTVTPQDLGMGWVVSKKKPDYAGKRSHARPGNSRPDRKQLVGLLPADRDLLPPEGSQLVGMAELPAPPVPMLGYVTSSYFSPALGRTFALALLDSGRDRIGDTVYAVVDDVPQPVAVVSSVLYDPDGLRRDGDPAVGDGLSIEPSADPTALDGPTGAGSPAPPVSPEEQAPDRSSAPVSPLAGYAEAFAALSQRSDPGVRIWEEPLTTMVNLRVRPDSAEAAAVAAALGVLLPARTGETSEPVPGSDLRVLALGPDEYMLLAATGPHVTALGARQVGAPEINAAEFSAPEPSAPEPSVPGRGAELAATIRAATPGVPVTDVSAARTVLRISGPAARQVLAHGCALDLATMPPGSCAQTMLAQCTVILAVGGQAGSPIDSIAILVRSSFAGHLARWLLLTAPEYL